MLQSTVTEPPPRTGGDERADGPACGSPLSGDIGARRARLGLLTEPAPGARLAELSTASPILTAPPEVLVGRSAELLRRWPDVRRAARQLAAATARSGVATATQCVHGGAYVFITGRRDPELAAAVKEIGSHGTGVQGDVSHLGDLDRLFAHIQREKGRLDSVCANAGAATSAPFGTITEEHYDAIFNVNVSGAMAS